MDSFLAPRRMRPSRAAAAAPPTKDKRRGSLGPRMRAARLRGDLSLVHQGFEIAAGFGVRSLEGLVSVAELLESSVYEAGSLRRTPTGFSFTLLNPPLRMGAFRELRVIVNGVAIPGALASVRLGDPPTETGLNAVDREHPVVLPVGERSRFEVRTPAPATGRLQVRLELQSVAIPPRVWFEFSDDVRPPLEAL